MAKICQNTIFIHVSLYVFIHFSISVCLLSVSLAYSLSHSFLHRFLSSTARSGASWKHPFGLDAEIDGILDHPVVHVSFKVRAPLTLH